MLGRDLELSRNVIADKLSEKRVILIRHKIVKSDSRADKYLLYFRYLLYLFYQLEILGVVYLEILTGCGS